VRDSFGLVLDTLFNPMQYQDDESLRLTFWLLEELLQKVDGVMLGREAYQNPYLLHGVDSRLFGEIAADKNRL